MEEKLLEIKFLSFHTTNGAPCNYLYFCVLHQDETLRCNSIYEDIRVVNITVVEDNKKFYLKLGSSLYPTIAWLRADKFQLWLRGVDRSLDNIVCHIKSHYYINDFFPLLIKGLQQIINDPNRKWVKELNRLDVREDAGLVITFYGEKAKTKV